MLLRLSLLNTSYSTLNRAAFKLIEEAKAERKEAPLTGLNASLLNVIADINYTLLYDQCLIEIMWNVSLHSSIQ